MKSEPRAFASSTRPTWPSTAIPHAAGSAPLAGYGLAWIGHFFFEHNRPATFRRPLYSLAGDWVMFRDILTGRITL
jgi:hypothetical protein